MRRMLDPRRRFISAKNVRVQKRRDNHDLDCDLLIDAAAVISGCLKTAVSDPAEKVEA